MQTEPSFIEAQVTSTKKFFSFFMGKLPKSLYSPAPLHESFVQVFDFFFIKLKKKKEMVFHLKKKRMIFHISRGI